MAEIRQKIISCNACGQYYDAYKHSDCPYCGGQGGARVNQTTDPNGISGEENEFERFSATVDPYTQGTKSEPFSHTIGVDPSTPAGQPSPVVGWLVAVAGPSRGTDYRIHTGYNSIGRERGDICIHGDNTISAEKDANVTYVFQNKKFYIAHDSGKNVLLVNDMPVIGGSTMLNDYDIITIGNTKLLFIGLCGEQFSWDDEGKDNA